MFLKKKRKSKKTIINNYGITSNDFKEIMTSIHKANTKKLNEESKEIAKCNNDLFILELYKTLEKRVEKIEYSTINNPDIQFILIESSIIATRQNSKIKREVLSNLIANRIKSKGYEIGELIYNESIRSVSLITNDQILILTVIEIITSLVHLILKEEECFEDYQIILDTLNNSPKINDIDIEHLKNCRLITNTFPYEVKTPEIIENSIHNDLIITIKAYFVKYKSLELEKYILTNTGKAIAQTNISIITKKDYNNLEKPPVILSDFKARNILAEGEMTAFSSK
jgi:hypothetical protein